MIIKYTYVCVPFWLQENGNICEKTATTSNSKCGFTDEESEQKLGFNFIEKIEDDDEHEDLDEPLDATDVSAIIPRTMGQGIYSGRWI